MAKRQNFVVGSTNSVTQSMTDNELNHGFDQYEILTADELDGVFYAVSNSSKDSSDEIANAIQSITGAQPTGLAQNELANALQQMRNEIETTSLTFKGYISTAAPSSSTYVLIEGNIWINSATLPTSFPIAASNIKVWDGSAWVNYGSTYTPADFDFFRNINDNEGYYWFGGQWTIMSTDMSTTYFTLNASGKWEIKSSVSLPGSPTTTTATTSDNSTKIATTAFVKNQGYAADNTVVKLSGEQTITGNKTFTGTTNVPTAATTNESSTVAANTQWTHNFANTMRTNCITEIPQDINLTLSSGTLTLKAGSKVYVPNGVDAYGPVYTQKTITSDVSYAVTWADTSQRMLFVTFDNDLNIVGLEERQTTYSGTTQPTTPSYFAWYDTTNNVIKMTQNSGSTWNRPKCSFPIAIFSSINNQVSSIDQVFNGFGYMGNTVFALPGVTGLGPNGYNTDGTLLNTVRSITTVQVKTMVNTLTDAKTFIVYPDSVGELIFGDSEDVIYNTESNKLIWSGISIDGFVCFEAGFTSGKVTSFTPKKVFRAVDYNESDFVVAFQRPTSTNNYTWYRKYKSGWVEQGGTVTPSGGSANVTLPIAMADTNYTFLSGATKTNTDASVVVCCVQANTVATTGFTLLARYATDVSSGAAGEPCWWQVSGMAS